jgi:hypothetical protein
MKTKLKTYLLVFLTIPLFLCINRENERTYIVSEDVKTHLNARSKPTLESDIVFKFKAGEKLIATSSSLVQNNAISWREIIYNDQKIWVSDSFLKPYLERNLYSQCLPRDFKSGCLGKDCSVGNCGNEYQFYFLDNGKFKATYTCHDGSEGNWFIQDGKLKAQSTEFIHPEDICDFENSKDCINKFKEDYGEKRIINDSFEFEVRKNSVIASITRKENVLTPNRKTKTNSANTKEIEVFCLQEIPESLNLIE